MLAAKEPLEAAEQSQLLLERLHQGLPATHLAAQRLHVWHIPHSRANQVAAANRRVSLTIHRLRTLQVPALMMKMTTMTVRIHQALVHPALHHRQLAVVVGVLRHRRHLRKASAITEVIVVVQKSVGPLHTVLLMARAVGSHLVLDHLHMDMIKMLGAMVVTGIGGGRGSHPKQAECRQVVEEVVLGMVVTMTGTRAGLAAPAPPALGHRPIPSAKLPTAVSSPTKGLHHHTHPENHERKRSLARGAGTERSSSGLSVPALLSHMVRQHFRKVHLLNDHCLHRRATAGSAKEACVVHHPHHAVGAMDHRHLVAPLLLLVRAQPEPLDTGVLAHLASGLAERHPHHSPLQTPHKETDLFLHLRQSFHLPSRHQEIPGRKRPTVMGVRRSMVGEVTLKAMTGAMILMGLEVDASEENLGMLTSHRHHHLTEAAGTIWRPLKKLTCLSQVKCFQTTRSVMLVNGAVTTKAGAVMDAGWITIAHGHRLPPWPACHHAVVLTWRCIAWTTHTHHAHETKTAGASRT